MDVLILTVILSLGLLVAAVALLAKSIKEGDLDHADRLSLMPLNDDDPVDSPEEDRS